MHRFRSILLSGLVALLMVGMVNASEFDKSGGTNDTDRIYIGVWEGSVCRDTADWKCLHLEFTFIWEIPL